MTTPLLPTTGPALFFVQTPALTSPAYLGTCEAPPTIEKQAFHTPVVNDLGGTAPFDFQYQGELALVSGVFNRFDGARYADLSQRPRYRGDATGTYQTGHWLAGEQGALTVQGLYFFGLWVYFPYYGGAKQILQGMPIGYYFPYCQTATDQLTPGSQVERQALAFQAVRKYTGGTSKFTLYSNDPGDFATLPLDAGTLV